MMTLRDRGLADLRSGRHLEGREGARSTPTTSISSATRSGDSHGYRLMAARIGELLAETWGLEEALSSRRQLIQFGRSDTTLQVGVYTAPRHREGSWALQRIRVGLPGLQGGRGCWPKSEGVRLGRRGSNLGIHMTIIVALGVQPSLLRRSVLATACAHDRPVGFGRAGPGPRRHRRRRRRTKTCLVAGHAGPSSGAGASFRP